MRKLMWYTLGFTLACIIGVYFVSGIWLFLLMLYSLAATVALFFVKSKAGKIIFTLLLGLTLGIFWLFCFDAFFLRQARDLDGTCVEAVIEVSDYSWERDDGIAAEGRVILENASYRVILYSNQDGSLRPGDRIEGVFQLRYTPDGGEKKPTYHQGNGIFLLAFLHETAG